MLADLGRGLIPQNLSEAIKRGALKAHLSCQHDSQPSAMPPIFPVAQPNDLKVTFLYQKWGSGYGASESALRSGVEAGFGCRCRAQARGQGQIGAAADALGGDAGLRSGGAHP